MASEKEILQAHPVGLAAATTFADTTQVNATDVFFKKFFPGIPLYGNAASPQAWVVSKIRSNGQVILTSVAGGAIKYIQNGGYFKTSASATVPFPRSTPAMDVLCVNNGMPFRILQVINDTTIVIEDPQGKYGTVAQSRNCWYAKSGFFPNKKVVLVGGDPFNVYPVGAVETAAWTTSGGTVEIIIGNSFDPIDIFGINVTTQETCLITK